MTASTRPSGSDASSTLARCASTSRSSAPRVPGYHDPATAAGRIESGAMATVLSLADVDRIAALARLELTDDERTRFATQLSAILAYADQVQQVDTSTVTPQQTIASVPRMRDDDLQPSLDRGDVLSQA